MPEEEKSVRIDKNFEGGNIRVLSISDERADLAVELRDTIGSWFYWAFRVTGAAGRTVTFHFPEGRRVGYYGAAVSHDLIRWQWTRPYSEDFSSFTYTFGPEEDEAYFCHHMRYSTGQFEALCRELHLPIQTLTLSEQGRPVPYVQIGSGEKLVLFTSRHHACESTGTYLLEGILRTLASNPLEDCTVIAVPFMDIDGVVNGDQGKNRAPYDHNVDYLDQQIYASTRALKQLALERGAYCFIDLHSPGHLGGRYDVVHIVNSKRHSAPQQTFGRLLTVQNEQHPLAVRYHTSNDLPFGVEWNNDQDGGLPGLSFIWFGDNSRLSVSLETPYFGPADNVVSQSAMIELGVCVAQAVRDFLS